MQLLQGQLGALMELPPTTSGAHFAKWDAVTLSLLQRTVGADHHITHRFKQLSWIGYGPADTHKDARAFAASRDEAVGLLDAAITELVLLDEPSSEIDDAMFDQELWEHVSPEVRAEAWGKAAAQALIFTEDRIRKWSGQPAGVVGKDLAVAVFGPTGNYRMGLTDGEKQGWQLFAQGVAQAVRNADAHRIQTRDDHRRYAFGVIGACSLLLTQVRHEHANRFQDATPVSVGRKGKDPS